MTPRVVTIIPNAPHQIDAPERPPTYRVLIDFPGNPILEAFAANWSGCAAAVRRTAARLAPGSDLRVVGMTEAQFCAENNGIAPPANVTFHQATNPESNP